MGLFGLFYTAFYATGCAINSFKDDVKNEERKRTTKNDEYQTYIDISGNYRLLSTNEIVEIRPNIDGNICMYKQFSKEPYRNLTQERNKKNYELNKNSDDGLSVVKYGTMKVGCHRIKANTYKDKTDGRLMFNISIFEDYHKTISHRFYIDVNDGKIIRPTERELEFNQELKQINSKNYRTDDWYQDFITKRNNEKFDDVFKDGFNDTFIQSYF